MKERIYDLNGRENCVTAVIRVGEKEFRISRVVTGVRVIYANLLTDMGQLLEELGRFDADKADQAALQEYTRKADAFAERKKTDYDRCLKLLLEKNGETYDPVWWQENTDEMDVRAFIDACFSKDAAGVKKK